MNKSKVLISVCDKKQKRNIICRSENLFGHLKFEEVIFPKRKEIK
jgi:hypothetical protein